MFDDRELSRFLIRLGLFGSPPEVFRDGVADLQDEMDQRDHLLNPRVTWEPEERCVVVEVEDIERDLQRAADNMAEELFEIAAGLLGDFEHFRVEILSMSATERTDGAN